LILLKYISIFCLLLNNGDLHDIHLSNTLVHYKSDESAIQLTVKIFADDLELAVKEMYGEEMLLLEKTELPHSDSLIQLYINYHFILSSENTLFQSHFIGKELSEDLSSVWCYLEYTDIKSFSQLDIQNSILTELFDDQKNMVMVKIDNKRKAHHTFSNDDLKTNLSF